MASSAAMTLMACYGAPCSSAEECAGGSFDDGGIGTDGYSETCDPDTPSEALDGELPLSVDGSLSGEGTNQGTCGGQGAELVYTWTPPSAGTYRFSTSGPADTVLYLRDREPLSCGMELGCDDDGGDGSSSTVTADLTGTPITIVVDSWSNTGGDFTLTIESP